MPRRGDGKGNYSDFGGSKIQLKKFGKMQEEIKTPLT